VSDELTTAIREELECLWHDLQEARLRATNGRWSIECGGVQDRIEKLTRLVGATAWESVPISLVEDGLYQRINRDLGLYVNPDMARVAEVRAAANRHPFQRQP
jgi:hypothetical protein